LASLIKLVHQSCSDAAPFERGSTYLHGLLFCLCWL